MGLFICVFVGLFICLFVGLFICVFVGLFICVFVGLFICVFVCQRDNRWTVWDIIVKFLREQDIVKSLDKFENCCILMHWQIRGRGEDGSDVGCVAQW